MACRTPICKSKRGGFKDTPADDLLAPVLKALIDRTKVNPSEVGDIVVDTVPIRTVNRQCSSGLQAVADVATSIKAGFYDIGIGAGLESMTTDGLATGLEKTDSFAQAPDCLLPMGITSENVVQRYGITRQEQDQADVESHRRAAAATTYGKFKEEIIPVATKIVNPKTGEEQAIVISEDDGILPDTNMAGLAKLKPAFKKDGTTTAGNASQVSDGARAVLLMKRRLAMQKGLPILGVLRSFAAVGVDPAVMGIGPAIAIPVAVKSAGLKIDEIGLLEINEAFASQFVYSCKKLGLDRGKVNVNGVAMALGHPLGCTGGDAMLTHLFLQTMTNDLPERIQRGDEEIWFHFPPAYTCFGREEFCLITGLRFGHDEVGRYISYISRPSWLSRVFPELAKAKPDLHVDDLKRLLIKDDFTRMDDLDVVRVCLLLLLNADFLGKEARKPISEDLILLVEDLNAWNVFAWGSYLWKTTWKKLSSAFEDRPSLRGDGSKYTLVGFIWVFKIWIFEAFPSMRTYTRKNSNDIHRAITWRMIRLLDWEYLLPYTTMNDRLTPTEAEFATDWWQARELRDEISALRDEVGTLRDDNDAWRDEVRSLCDEKPDSPVIIQEAPPTIQESPVIVQEVPPTVQEPDSHDILCRHIDKPPHVPDMMDESWLSYELPVGTIPQQERRTLPDTIMDNTLWAKTAVNIYLHEQSQGCYANICKIDESNGKAKLYPSWWEVDKLPSLKTIVYDNMLNYIPFFDFKDIICKGWSAHLAKYLDVIDCWTNSGNKKPKKFKVTMMRYETTPQQIAGARGDCGPLVCICLERLTTGCKQFLPPTDRDRGAVGLWFHHFMARAIYSRRCLPASTC
ncbi:3-ketoacyl-CoA thiolase 5, peroxisomal [Hibiscus syriacus]|uniref:3-ketoacyl-CoA thiolase 5, peroxisomal n=1 Tax=Hibiscus syriacus TaxID=106335 RepID=A0A6A3A8U4_HIBSY|nr:3-ketoacyl-CoA thiolase 5, peroxisomal [Hibiscus syriacus]